MAKRKTTRRKAPAARRSYSAAPRKTYRRRKSGISDIPAAAATVGVAVAMKEPIMTVLNNMSVSGVKSAVQQATTVNTLKKTAIYGAAAYIGGEALKKYGPKIIKNPAGKIAKKLPKFF